MNGPTRFNVFLGTLALCTVLLGTVGFREANSDFTGATALLSALQLLTMASGAMNGPVPWTLEVARWTGVLFFSSAIFRIASGVAKETALRGRLVLERLMPLWWPMRPRCVVIGLGRKGISLVEDLQGQVGQPYRILGIDEDTDRVALARDMGIDAIRSDGTGDAVLRHIPWRRTPWMVLLMGRDESNVQAALRSIQLRSDSGTKIAVHVPTLQFRDLLERQDTLQGEGVRLFNHYERLARRSLLAYPVEVQHLPTSNTRHLDPVRGVQGVSTAQEQVPHIYIRPSRGFTAALVAALARSAHFPRTERRTWTVIRVFIVGQDADQQRHALYAQYPALNPHLQRGIPPSGQRSEFLQQTLIDLQCLTPNPGQSPAQAIATHVHGLPAETPVTAFLDIHDPGLALLEALTIVDMLNLRTPTPSRSSVDLRCVFDFADEPGIVALVDSDAVLGRMLRPLPSLADCVGTKSLFDDADRLDVMAQHIHARYDSTGTQPWASLSLELQDSNRAAADHLSIVSRFLAERGRPITGPDYQFEPADLEALAECEHRRWAAQKLMAGWVPDPSLGEEQDRARKRHGCLSRQYEDLSELMQERDRNNIRAIPELLAFEPRKL